MFPLPLCVLAAGQLIGGARHSLWVIAMAVVLVAIIALLVWLQSRTRVRDRGRGGTE